MNRFFFVLLFMIVFSSSYGWMGRNITLLQHGERVFETYCSGCHALEYLNLERMQRDLGGPVGHDLSQVSLPKSDAIHWFGRMPPDLSLIARVRGASWLSAYLKGFYADAHRPFGANNTLIPNVAMPNVFAPMTDDVRIGVLRQQDVDAAIHDVVLFLVYVAEPAALERYRMGGFVILWLCFMVLFLRLWIKSHIFKHETVKCGKILTCDP
jgi:ubiquinol-cytochrome c reductase cytochrome c1 subunit